MHFQLAHLCRFAVRSPYVYPEKLFLGTTTLRTSLCRSFARIRNSSQLVDLPASLINSLLEPGLPSPGCALPYASFHRNIWRYGNINPFPIDYAFQPRLRGRLTLGKITFTLESLGFRRTGISPVFSLLMPAFSLLSPPANLPVHLHRYIERSSTPSIYILSRGFGDTLSPVTLSAHNYSTSELLRTL